MTPDGGKFLGIYLQDHFAGATSGSAMASRIAKSHEHNPQAQELRKLADDIEEDRSLLREIMASLDIEPSASMDAAAEVGERLGRLKLNGKLLSRSPLSNVVEFELMRLGVAGKLSCWLALRSLADTEPRLSAEALDGLITRAQSQLLLLDARWADSVASTFV
jgi:hypothetical protein